MLDGLFSSVLLLLAAAGTVAAAQTGIDQERPLGSHGRWKRVFTEEFESPTLDGEMWTTCYWWNDNGCTNLGNKELQWYLPENVQLSDGRLRLTARPQTVTGYKGQVFDYTSGIVTTGNDYNELPRPPRVGFLYGHFEIRAKLPAGQGLWPALWLLPANRESRPEIDIMEVLGHATDQLQMHFHYVDKKGERRSVGKTVRTPDLSRDWHVYGLRWQPGSIVWYLDGIEQWRYDKAAHVPSEQMYLLINLAVGGNWPGAPDSSTRFPAEILIDYVRVWQRAEQ